VQSGTPDLLSLCLRQAYMHSQLLVNVDAWHVRCTLAADKGRHDVWHDRKSIPFVTTLEDLERVRYEFSTLIFNSDQILRLRHGRTHPIDIGSANINPRVQFGSQND
jgi:hypothetical protein